MKKSEPKITLNVESRTSLAKRRATLKTAPVVSTIFPEITVKDVESTDCLRVSSLSPPTHDENDEKTFTKSSLSSEDFFSGHPPEWKEMTEMIVKDVVKRDLCVKWEDVLGQDDAKMIMQESVIFPLKYPSLYNRVKPWKGS